MLEAMDSSERPIVWLHGDVKSPPFSKEARIQAGFLLRLLQEGDSLKMPWSRPIPDIGARCQELRIDDKGRSWRIIYRADAAAILIAEVFEKKTPKTPKHVIDVCRRRIRDYDST
jgi:phage-related protein